MYFFEETAGEALEMETRCQGSFHSNPGWEALLWGEVNRESVMCMGIIC